MRATEESEKKPHDSLEDGVHTKLSPMKNHGDNDPGSQATITAAAATADLMAIAGTTPSPTAKADSAPTAPLSPPSDELMDVTMELAGDSVRDSCDAAVVTMDVDVSKVTEESSIPIKDNGKSIETKREAQFEKDAVAPTEAEDLQIKKGDDVRVLYEVPDMFNEFHNEWYIGTVAEVISESSSSSTISKIRVQYDDHTIENCSPGDLEKLDVSIQDSNERFFPKTFSVGDIVDAKHQDKPKWYRGRIADVSKDGSLCDVMYYDQDYESRIPSKEKKIRLIQRSDSSGEWLMGRAVSLKGSDSRLRSGTVSHRLRTNGFEVSFSDGSSESFSYKEVVKAVLQKHIHNQHVWPIAHTNNMAETIALRRRRTAQKNATNELSEQERKPALKIEKQLKPGRAKSEKKPVAKSSGRTRSSSRTVGIVKTEPIAVTDVLTPSGKSSGNCRITAGNQSGPFEVGTIVCIEDRTWPGRNDPGGVARICKVHHASNGSITYDVKYVLESRKENAVEDIYVSLHTEYVSPSKQRRGCIHNEGERKQTRKISGRSQVTSKSKTTTTKKVVKSEPVEAADEVDDASMIDHDDSECLALQALDSQGPAVAPPVLENRNVAKDFPAGLPNVLWCALNSPEPQTGANFLRDLLCVHDAVPPSTMVQKLMDLMKYGPKAEGSSVYFKDPQRIELASDYVYGLVSASSRLVRDDETALFGPSSWDDIDVLLSQSISETENMVSGRRLAQGLQLAARGAKLLALMLATELQGENLYSTSSPTFDSTSPKAMPTARLVRSYGVRSGLKAAVEHMTKCLVRHSRWVMDQVELVSSGSDMGISDECCALEARLCLESLGSVICFTAWLFCVEEKVEVSDPDVAFVIKDAFLIEMRRCLEDVPEMNERDKKKFVKKLKMYFLLYLSEEFCTPIVVTLGKMMGVDDELALVGLVA